MDKRSQTGGKNRIENIAASETGVVDFADARVRLRPRSDALRASLMAELDGVHLLLDQGQISKAKVKLSALITAARQEPSILAQARCALSIALEMEGRYPEMLAA